jgi:hypothetical protein
MVGLSRCCAQLSGKDQPEGRRLDVASIAFILNVSVSIAIPSIFRNAFELVCTAHLNDNQGERS